MHPSLHDPNQAVAAEFHACGTLRGARLWESNPAPASEDNIVLKFYFIRIHSPLWTSTFLRRGNGVWRVLFEDPSLRAHRDKGLEGAWVELATFLGQDRGPSAVIIDGGLPGHMSVNLMSVAIAGMMLEDHPVSHRGGGVHPAFIGQVCRARLCRTAATQRKLLSLTRERLGCSKSIGVSAS
jgi:hypothetical protein